MQKAREHVFHTTKRTTSKPSVPNFGPNSTSSNVRSLLSSIDDPFKGLSKTEAYTRLIDAYRLRIEDEYTFEGDASALYAEEDPVPDFRRFLKRAKQKKVSPSWWNPIQDDRDVLELAKNDEDWPSIYHAVEKSDIIEHYGNSFMPMILRV